MSLDRVVLVLPSGRKLLVRLDGEIVSVPSIGVVHSEALRQSIGRRHLIGSRAVLVLTPSVRDMVGSIQREAQIVGAKDSAAIVWNCDLKAGDRVVEGGAGSGALTVALARAVAPNGRVYSYDIREDFLQRSRANVSAAGLLDLTQFCLGDVRRGVDEREVDAFILDIPDPWAAVATAASSLRACGHFASYSPNTEQVSQTVAALRQAPFVEIRTVEIIEREVVSQKTGTHPSFAPLGHTGYLTFARKVLDTF